MTAAPIAENHALMASSVTGIILLVLAVILLFRGVPGVLALLASRSWTEVPGTIVASGVQSGLTQAGDAHGRARVTQAVVTYSYEAGGQTLMGNRAAFGTPLSFGMGLGGIASAQSARHEPGAGVTVWVDPRNPANSVLRRSAPSSVVLTAIGLAVLVLGLLSL